MSDIPTRQANSNQPQLLDGLTFDFGGQYRCCWTQFSAAQKLSLQIHGAPRETDWGHTDLHNNEVLVYMPYVFTVALHRETCAQVHGCKCKTQSLCLQLSFGFNIQMWISDKGNFDNCSASSGMRLLNQRWSWLISSNTEGYSDKITAGADKWTDLISFTCHR